MVITCHVHILIDMLVIHSLALLARTKAVNYHQHKSLSSSVNDDHLSMSIYSERVILAKDAPLSSCLLPSRQRSSKRRRFNVTKIITWRWLKVSWLYHFVGMLQLGNVFVIVVTAFIISVLCNHIMQITPYSL